jgi:hypothetical protein
MRMSVKQLGSMKEAGGVTCWEWPTAAQLELRGFTSREEPVQLGNRGIDGKCGNGQNEPSTCG